METTGKSIPRMPGVNEPGVVVAVSMVVAVVVVVCPLDVIVVAFVITTVVGVRVVIVMGFHEVTVDVRRDVTVTAEGSHIVIVVVVVWDVGGGGLFEQNTAYTANAVHELGSALWTSACK
jgi:hypothetical protein